MKPGNTESVRLNFDTAQNGATIFNNKKNGQKKKENRRQ